MSHEVQEAQTSVAVITGGASGIGLATARRFRETGWKVAVLDRDAAVLEEAWRNEPDVVRQVCDVSVRQSVTEALDRVHSTLGAPTALVNSAGIYRPDQALDITDEDFDTMFAVNVRGTFLTSQITARLMAAGGGGCIVNVSSVAAYETTDVNVAYAATKGAVSSLTRGLAVSLAASGIRVNAVAPGPIATPMGAAATTDPAREAHMLRRVLSGRFAVPDDVAGAVTFLCGPDASYITGHTLVVDGGVLAQR
ncbi:SDR family NAD(P)-dependent oxidoreductase [Streptomyces sp. R39]|uniref:SDR family NAD(P)-dependent oxidoreductase n=1 Tax=Streptomyces sp. R39 TaxID=3238631 RepID=A0AB39QVT4_9ACTN